jgi:hypothetical protein
MVIEVIGRLLLSRDLRVSEMLMVQPFMGRGLAGVPDKVRSVESEVAVHAWILVGCIGKVNTKGAGEALAITLPPSPATPPSP